MSTDTEKKPFLSKTVKNILIIVGIAFVLIYGFDYYSEYRRVRLEQKWKEQTAEKQRIIDHLNDSVKYLVLEANKFEKSIKELDSIIKKQKETISNIPVKYIYIKEKVKELNKVEAVKYLSERLKLLDPNYNSKYPILTLLENDTVTIVDSKQTTNLNTSFVNYDCIEEELGATKVLVGSYEKDITELKGLVSNQKSQIKIKDSIYKIQKDIIKNDSINIEKLNNKLVTRAWVERVLGGIAGVMTLIAIFK